MSEFLKHKILEEILLENEYISSSQLTWAKMRALECNIELTEILIAEKFITDIEISKAIALQYGLEYFYIDESVKLSNVTEYLSLDFIKNNKCIPLNIDQNILTVAIHHSPDTILSDDIERITSYKVNFVISPKSCIEKKLSELEKQNNPLTIEDLSVESVLKKLENDNDKNDNDTDIINEVHNNPIVTLINKIIYNAVSERASDIHIEPTNSAIRIRYRVDGELIYKLSFSLKFLNNVISRLKILADLDITEKVIPQEGRFKIKIKGEDIDFRITIIPSLQGESVNIRVLNKKITPLEITKLGFEEFRLDIFKQCIEKLSGMILVCGSTGSGKTTTLYSSLKHLDSGTKKIITIEDPVEYQFPEIHQIPVRLNKSEPDREITFSKGIRVILRQDPDIIMIGEIRDFETASIAMQAALTGHLVLSSVHARNSIDVILRLKHLGIDTLMFSNAISSIISQKLIKKLCSCKIPDSIDNYPNFKNITGKEEINIYKANGCSLCKNTGYYERTGVFELLVIDDKIRKMIAENELPTEIENYALNRRKLSLEHSLQDKFLKGIIDHKEYKKYRKV